MSDEQKKAHQAQMAELRKAKEDLEQTVKRLQGAEESREFPDPDVSIAGSAYLPDSYISDASQKLHLYMY